jgi:hypothetical protein
MRSPIIRTQREAASVPPASGAAVTHCHTRRAGVTAAQSRPRPRCLRRQSA